MTLVRTGVPMVISAPSGGGKTTLCRKLMARRAGIEFSISHTTRPLRGKERDGVDYHFVSEAEFESLVAAGVFLEWAWVHGHRYGTTRAPVEAQLARGTDVLFDIDVQGGRQILERLPGALLVFVLPPDLATLEARLRQRHSDSEDQITRRLAAARQEIEQAALYTHWIVNDVLDRALDDLDAVLTAERLRRTDKTVLARTLLGGGRV